MGLATALVAENRTQVCGDPRLAVLPPSGRLGSMQTAAPSVIGGKPNPRGSVIPLRHKRGGGDNVEMRSVLIVDDHPGFRLRARRLLEAEGWNVVGEAGDAAEALRAAEDLQPEVVLLDVHLPDVNGLCVARTLSGDAAVVLTSSRDASDFADRLAGSGARGFVPKSELSGDALSALLP
jgi:CheY-like chemotaxis protein